MAKRQFELNEREMGRFRQAEQQTGDVRELKHLQAVRLYGSGVSMAEIVNIVACGASSVRQWVQSYQQGGIEALGSHWRGGNANKLTPAQRGEIRERVHQYRPLDLHFSQGQFWTVSDLRIAVQQWYGVSYQSEDSYLHLLHGCGLSYQRAERVYRSQPSQATLAEFQAELEKK
jgi:transposase